RRAAHRLDDIAEKTGVQVAEKADRAPVGTQMREHPYRRWLHDPLRRRRVAALVERAEIAAVERDVVGVLTAQHGVRLSAGGDQDRSRRQYDFLTRGLVRVGSMAADFGHCMPGQPQSGRLTEEIDLDFD